ncbi:MAG: S8 family serine peptidase [Acidobacteria bacterium]|nr:S8 family serine peptidase [Acidobacteriota bacterium]MBV9476308.1 S8 family serine peptidase [Acidobacteriota bacterium]
MNNGPVVVTRTSRFVVAVFALLVAGGAFAADATQQYLVATKHAFKTGGLAEAIRDAGGTVRPRNVVGFQTFDGFAADLTPEEVAALRNSASVRWIEPVVERHAFSAIKNNTVQTVPYGVAMIHSHEANLGHRSGVVNVAVVDTGIDYRHPELAPVYMGGYNFVASTPDPMDDAGHGTHVAGTIAAADNQSGVVGVTPGIRLWAVKVLNAQGSGTNSRILRGLDWVVQQKQTLGGNWVVNMSLGGASASQAEAEAFQRASDAGVIVVAASGNDSTADTPAPVSYPAAYPSVFAVGAVDQNSAIADFSNQGPELAVVAPGVHVLSTVPLGTGTASYLRSGNAEKFASALDGAPISTVTGQYVYCGLGRPEDFPADLSGKIALIQRGELFFGDKTRNAKERGAIAVVIYNNDDSAISWTLVNDADPTTKTYAWPLAVGITKADGEALKAAGTGTITIANETDDYGYLNGTSMATPHVTAAVALLWTLAPSATPAQLKTTLLQTATDLGTPGADTVFGAGLIDLNAAANRLAPAAFGPSRPTTGRRFGHRG